MIATILRSCCHIQKRQRFVKASLFFSAVFVWYVTNNITSEKGVSVAINDVKHDPVSPSPNEYRTSVNEQTVKRPLLDHHSIQGFNLSRDFSAVPPSETLLLFHYHKTGHELTRSLAYHSLGCQEQKSLGQCKFFRRHYNIDSVRRFAKKPNKHLAILNPSMELLSLFDWNEIFPTNSSTRLVHFIRDPFQMLSSAFTYHSQPRVPHLERGWINKPQSDPCNKEYRNIVHGLASSIAGEGVSKTEVDRLFEMCESIYAAHGNETRLWTLLQKVDVKEGLQLTAITYLVQSTPQMLIMWKALQLFETFSSQVYTSMLSQWTTSYSTFRHSATQLCQMANLSVINRTVMECVERAVENSYINQSSTTISAHVTSNMKNKGERQKHLQILVDDKLLGPILLRLQEYAWHTWSMQFKSEKSP